MISDIDLLNRYKEEKALVIGSVEERTGLEPFPTWKEWKAEYVKEYNETHVTVDVKEADAIMDAAVEEAEEELDAMVDEFDSETETEEEDDMSDATPAATEVPAKPKRVAKKKVAAKKKAPRTKPVYATKKKVVAKKAPAKKPVSKASKARKIFDRFYGKKARAEIIEKFVGQAGLTANGAATYYQKMKKAADAG